MLTLGFELAFTDLYARPGLLKVDGAFLAGALRAVVRRVHSAMSLAATSARNAPSTFKSPGLA